MTALEMGSRVFLRKPTARDRDEFLELVRVSRRLHHPWVSPPNTPDRYAAYLRRMRADRAVGLLLCRRTDGAIVGVINLNEIVRQALQSAYLGYYVGTRFAGQGYMTEGIQLVMRHAFTTMALHRLEANIQPANAASRALAQRCGLRFEGISLRYLRVGRRWRDHERWAITIEDWRVRRKSTAKRAAPRRRSVGSGGKKRALRRPTQLS